MKKTKFILLTIGILISLSSTVKSVPDSIYVFNEEFKVDSIKIIGNEITQDFIILRELTFQEGDIVNSSVLAYNRERVFSLRLFNRVSVYPVLSGEKTFVFIDLDESWYIYPIPFIRRQDRSSNKYSYGIDLLYKNFRGRNEYLRAVLSFGYNPSFSLIYENPAVSFENDLGIAFGVSYINANNKSSAAEYFYGKQFKNKYYSSGLILTKRFNQFHDAFLQLAYDYIEVPSDRLFNGISATGTYIDRTLSLGIGYAFDSRDLKQFPQDGTYSSLQIKHKGFGINNINYNIINVDFRQYRRIIENLTAKWRIALRHTFGKIVPYYDYSYLGYDEYIRGNSDKNREGHNLMLYSVECSYPVLKEFDFSIKLPLLPRSLTSARIGIFISAFADAGHAFDNIHKLKLNDSYYGYGFGITVLTLPYNSIRFEYAFDEKGKGELIIGAGFSF